MEEIWKPCPFAEQSHQVSSHGRVKKLGHYRKYRPWKGESIELWRPEFILKPMFNHRGYSLVNITNDILKGKYYQVHRLVAMAFVEGYNELLQVNHIDGNNKNNVYTNLEWCTASENQRHSYDVLGRAAKLRPTKGESSVNAKLTESEAIEILNSKDRAMTLAKRFGVHRDTVYNIQDGKRWAHIHHLKNKDCMGDYRDNLKIDLTKEMLNDILFSKETRAQIAAKHNISISYLKEVRKRHRN